MNQPIIAPPATFSPDYKSAPLAPRVPSALAPSKVASPSGAFSVTGGSKAVPSAEVLLAWLDARAANLRVLASDAWINNHNTASDQCAEQACAIEDALDDLRREMGLANPAPAASNIPVSHTEDGA